jgi:uncharacterized damage-inducible protein DinB
MLTATANPSPLAQTLLPELDHELVLTRRLLERLPEEHFGWQPHAKSMTLIQLASHTANVLAWVAPTFDTPEYDMASEADEEDAPATSRAALLERLEANGAAARATLANADAEDFAYVWTFRNGEQVLFSQPRAEVVRTYFLSHLIHHRGQLSVYLRLLDVPVPSIYGPSADEPSR